MAKYLATSLATLKVVKRPPGHEELLADFDDFDELGGVRVQVHHVAGLFGSLGAGIHGHPDVGLGQGRGVVGPVPGHGHQVPGGLLAPDQGQLVLRLRLGQKIVHPGLLGDDGGGERIVAGNHDGGDAHGPEAEKAVRQAALDDVLEVDGAIDFSWSATTRGVPPREPMRWISASTSGGSGWPRNSWTASAAPLR